MGDGDEARIQGAAAAPPLLPGSRNPPRSRAATRPTPRIAQVVRLPGGLSYPREPAGTAALVELMCDTADNPPDDDQYTDSDESYEDPMLAAQRAREAARKIESDNPFSLDAYYPMADDASLADSTSANKHTTDKSNALVANSVLGKIAHRERKLTLEGTS